jgi:2-oxo-4-hydroxy-4-carboxy-5-ureidoimidazoline decarboxylase
LSFLLTHNSCPKVRENWYIIHQLTVRTDSRVPGASQGGGGGTALAIEQINNLGRDEFMSTFGTIFEGSPWIAAGAWDARPFANVEQLHEAMCRVMYDAPFEQKLALIRAHPDLVGEAALAGTLSRESTREQSSAGLDSLSPEEIAMFTRLNKAYRDKFGFPFVICAGENKKDSILAGFDARLNNSREEEIDTALHEIAKITRLRLIERITNW